VDSFKYINGPSGSGKTYASLQEVRDLVVSGERVIVCQPSKLLIKQSFVALRKLDPDIHIEMRHGDNTKKVVKSISAYLDLPYPEPHVLFITWAAFERLQFVRNAKHWHLIIDEIPQAYYRFEKPLAKNHQLLTDRLKLGEYITPDYQQLLPKTERALDGVIEGSSSDVVDDLFREIASLIKSKHWETYVNAKSYQCLLGKMNRVSVLSAFSILNPAIFSSFKSVTIAGALFKESILYLLWSKMGVKFIEASGVSLRYQNHDHVKNLKILWSIEQDYSKFLRDQDDQLVFKEMVKANSQKFADVAFLWSGNKDIGYGPFEGLQAIRLPAYPHGLNSYQHIDNVVFLSARNPSPALAKFLQMVIGEDRETIRTAIHRQQVYQAIMRGSLRDPSNERDKCVYVPDLATAEWLKSKFSNAVLEHLPLDLGDMKLPLKPGRKRIHDDGAARTASSRQKKTEQIERFLRLLNCGKFPNSLELEKEKQCQHCNDILPYKDNFVTQFKGTIWASKREKMAEFNLLEGSDTSFETLLKKLYNRPYREKEENRLISPSYFIPNISKDEFRTEDNIIFSRGFFLDKDHPGILPEEFAALFPNLRMTIYNTTRSTKSNLRYRVYIPTTKIMMPEEYRAITKRIIQTLVDAGYSFPEPILEDDRKAHGFDTTKLGPTNLFYLPCQPRDPSGRYFKTFKSNGRKPLIPSEWYVDEEVVEPQNFSPFSFEPSENVKEGWVERARTGWREKGSAPSQGNHEFFNLAVRLAWAGCHEVQIKQILTEEAHFANTPKDRINQIPSILNSLRKPEYRTAYSSI